MDGVEVSVMGWSSTLVNVSPCTRPSCLKEQSCVSKPMCSCQLNQFLGVDVSCQVWTLCKAFRKWNGFGDDVIAEQPSHPCLVVHDAVCHVTPCVFLLVDLGIHGVFYLFVYFISQSRQNCVILLCSFFNF